MNYDYTDICLTIIKNYFTQSDITQKILNIYNYFRDMTNGFITAFLLKGRDNNRILIVPKFIRNNSNISEFSICDIIWLNNDINLVTSNLFNITLEDGSRYGNVLIVYSLVSKQTFMVYSNGDILEKIPIKFTTNIDKTFIKISKAGNSSKFPMIKQVISFSIKLPY